MFNGSAPNFARRSKQAEWMDGANYSLAEFTRTLADIRRINRYLGGFYSLKRRLFPMIEALNKSRVRLLDVGTGSADLPTRIVDWGRARGISVDFVVLDLNEIAAREAHAQTRAYPEIKVIRADAMNLPFEDQSFDFVLASLFLHHFDTRPAAQLLRGFARVASAAFIINDLRRHPVAYYTIKILTRVLTNNPMLQNDSALSVLRGFTDSDISEIAQAAQTPLEVFRQFPYRYILIGRQQL